MTTKTLASSLAALALFAVQGAVEPVWPDKPIGDLTTVNAVGFEHFAVGVTPAAGYADDGTLDSSKSYFLYQATNGHQGTSDDDNSIVTNYENGATLPQNVPAYFSGLDNDKYLSLSTEGGTLFRSLNVINTEGETPALGTAEEIQESGLFVDTLVQFTPCEEAPSVESGNKLAIWLNVETNAAGEAVGTNLCVKAGYLTYEDSTYGRTSATYTLANTSVISIEAGEWVRLTVKAIRNIYSNTGLTGQPAFQVFINDELAVFNENVGSADYMTQLATDDADAKTALEANTILPSMQDDAYLQAVGFQGTGAVDDFVVTTQKPGFLAVDFTLFWDSNILALDAYLNDSEDPVDFTGADLSKVFEGLGDGDTLEIELPAAGTSTSVAEGYEIDWENTVLTNATMEPLTYQGNVYAYLFTLDGDGPYSVTLVTKSSTPVVPFDGGSGTELDPYIIGSAASFTELQTKVLAGDTFSGKFFQLSGDVDFQTLGLNPFAGIGTYDAAITNGVPFSGTFDGAGYKISNVDFTQRNYAGIFNQVNGGTIKNLTVSNITCSTFSSEANGGEFALSIIGHAGNGATLQNIVAEGTYASAEQPCTHNVAGIVIRLSADALVKDCTNNAALYGCYTKLGGIAALTQTGSVPVRFEGCVNNGTITALQNADAAKPGRDGVAGIVAYVALPTVIKDCSNTGAMSSVLSTAAIGELVGKNDSSAGVLTDEGNNTGAAANKFVGVVGSGTGFKYATVDGSVATTTTNLVKDTTYLLENNIAASATPVFALAAANDYIAFDKTLGYTFAGDVVIADGIVGLQVTSNEVNNVITFTAEPFGAPTPTIHPGDADVEVTATSADEATNKVDLVIADAAAEAAGQAAVVKLVATPVLGVENKWSVAVAIDTNAVGFVDADVTVADVATNLTTVAAAVGSTVSITIPAADVTPGLYYSVAMVTDLATADAAAWAAGEGARALAGASHGADLTLVVPKPTSGTKAFYKVLVNMTGTPTPPPNAGE